MEEFLWVLKQSERDLVREVEPARLAKLDEEELLALHKRVRRARNKHLKNYRRGGAKRVTDAGGRGAAAPKGAKARLRAAAFEEALALVSERLGVVAHEAAEELKSERIAKARKGRGSGPEVSAGSSGKSGGGRARKHEKTTGGKKRDAASKSKGKRRQAKRDAR